MRRTRSLSTVAAATLAGYAIAAGASTQIPADRTITQIGSYGDIGYVVFTPAIPNLEGCPYSAGDEVIIDWTANSNAKVMYATALAAYLAGQRVGFGVSGCYPGSAPLAYRVDVKP